MSTVAILQARMSSTRLPGKVLMELCGQPLLYHIIKRVEQTKELDKIIVATSEKKEDDPIASYANSIGIGCFRGSEENVLSRFFLAASMYQADIIVRLTGDNPLVDPKVLETLLTYFKGCGFPYASCVGYPLGLGAEVFTFEALADAYAHAEKEYEREHVTPYMYRDPEKTGKLAARKDLSSLRFTVDTPEDFKFVKCVYDALYHGSHDFYLNDILDLLEKNPNLIAINENVRQKRLGE